MDPTLILGTVGVKQEYTLDGKTVYTHKHTHKYLAMSLGGILHSDRKQKILHRQKTQAYT